MDRTLILVKPDAFARRLTGEIIARFERKGLHLAAMRLMTLDEQTARRHYAEHQGKPFFVGLVIAATNGIEAAPGSIRGDYALEVRRNLVHGSDSRESAEREIGIYFGEDA
jgi:nucleoside-diphosphate kinase